MQTELPSDWALDHLAHLYTDDARANLVAVDDPPVPVLFDFDAGWPAAETFPVEAFRELAGKVLDDPMALGYRSIGRQEGTGARIYHSSDHPGREEMQFGYTELRREVARWISRREHRTDLSADNVILTSGATQAIALATTAFVGRGEGALIEQLTFSYAAKSLALRGARVSRVALDENGMDMDSLEARLREFKREGIRPKLLYTIPSFHLPTGTVLPLDRRKRMLELASEWDLIVIEDAMYASLHYDGGALPPSLFELDTSGRVLQAHSFSKIVAPGLRLGWIAGPRSAIRALGAVREDLGVSQWLSRILAEFMAEGRLDPLIVTANRLYRRKRDLGVSTLHAHAGASVHFTPPNGGIYLWIALNDSVDWDVAEREAALRGVAVRSTAAFAVDSDVTHFRLGFGHPTESELARGIPLLCEALLAASA